jgi:hypothetical protein
MIKVASSPANSKPPRRQKRPRARLLVHSSPAPMRALLRSSHSMGDVASTVDLLSEREIGSNLFLNDFGG